MDTGVVSFSSEWGTAELYGVTGKVLASERNSELHVSGGGVGGYVHNGSGVIVGPDIVGETINSHDFWLMQPNGKETHVHIPDYHVPIREGHTVTVFFAKRQNGTTEFPHGLYIHNTETQYSLRNSRSLVDGLTLQGSRGLTIVVCLCLFLGPYILIGNSSSFAWGSFLSIAYGLYRVFRREYKKQLLSQKLDSARAQHFDSFKAATPLSPSSPLAGAESASPGLAL
jgi:hypothetical protein